MNTYDYRIISTDDHVIEPPDVWQKRVPGKYRERAPRVIRDGEHDYWVIEDERVPQGVGGLGAVAGRRYEDYTPKAFPGGFSALRPGFYDAKARLADMDQDGVDAQVIYPTLAGLGQGIIWIQDAELHLLCIQAYNDWIAQEWCAVDRRRLIPQCIVPLWDAGLAVAEFSRAVKLGHKSLIFSGSPDALGHKPLHDRSWDPLWAAAQESGVPVALHIGGAVSRQVFEAMPTTRGGGVAPEVGPLSTHASNMGVMANVIFCGLLERFPRLKVISVESGVGWVPYFLELADDVYRRHHFWTKSPLRHLPSEYFRRQVSVTFWNEKAGLRNRDLIGIENILWESDYPHSISSWPRSRELIEDCFSELPESDRRKILAENAVKLYQLE